LFKCIEALAGKYDPVRLFSKLKNDYDQNTSVIVVTCGAATHINNVKPFLELQT
jgi:hypothetical protein